MNSKILKNLGPPILVILGVGLLRMSWQKWMNLTVDYGRELYVPWRITCGQVLYKDIASLFGPFPPYWNALLFKIFGASIMTLVLFNILLVAAITVLLYRFFSRTTDKWAAFAAGAAFLSMLAFKQSTDYMDQGNHAFICPYSYSVTYALFFSLWAIDLFAAHLRSAKDTLLGPVGGLIGLAALCRSEIFIFLVAAIALGLTAEGITGQWPLTRFLKAAALVLGGFFVPVGIAYLYFSTQLPLNQVAPSILGFNNQWREIIQNNYYKFMLGIDHPVQNFKIMLTTSACYGLAAIMFKCLCAGRDRLEKKGQRRQGAVFVLLGMAGAAQVIAWILFHYSSIFRGLPVMLIFMAGYFLVFLVRHKQHKEKVNRILPLLVMTVWGLLMLTKVFLRAQINLEGFVYAMPGVMLLIVYFQGFMPGHLEGAPKRDYFVRTLVCVLLGLVFLVGLKSTAFAYRLRTFPVQAGPYIIMCDRVYDARVGETAAFLKDADKIMGKDANFVAFPDGAMLNFLTKRTNPLPYITFMSAEIVGFGEQKMLFSFKEHRPDYVVFFDKPLPAKDSSDPGIKYPRALRAWILANYRPVWPAHPEPGNSLTVLKRLE